MSSGFAGLILSNQFAGQFSSEFSSQLSSQFTSQFSSQFSSQFTGQFSSQFSSQFSRQLITQWSSEYSEILSFLHALAMASSCMTVHITWWFSCVEFKIVLVIMYIYIGLRLPSTLSSELTLQKNFCSRLSERPVPTRLFYVTNNLVLIREFFISSLVVSLGDSWQQATVHYTPLCFASGHSIQGLQSSY